jgi:hypothetical protein
MRKFSLFALLGVSLLLVGCGSSPEETKQEFATASCNKFATFMECLVGTLTGDEQTEIRNIVEATKQQWKTLPENEQETTCAETLATYEAGSGTYEAYGCSLK